jgi:hypothetical protein
VKTFNDLHPDVQRKLETIAAALDTRDAKLMTPRQLMCGLIETAVRVRELATRKQLPYMQDCDAALREVHKLMGEAIRHIGHTSNTNEIFMLGFYAALQAFASSGVHLECNDGEKLNVFHKLWDVFVKAMPQNQGPGENGMPIHAYVAIDRHYAEIFKLFNLVSNDSMR